MQKVAALYGAHFPIGQVNQLNKGTPPLGDPADPSDPNPETLMATLPILDQPVDQPPFLERGG